MRAWEWILDRGAAFVAGARPLMRREPLPSRPLVVVAASLAAGCVAARWIGGLAADACLAMAWWSCAVVAVAVWVWARMHRRGAVGTAAVCVAMAAAGGAWSAASFDLFPADDLGWRLGTSPRPVAIRGVVVESFRALPPRDASPGCRSLGPVSECVVAVHAVRIGSRWRPASGRAAVVVAGPPPAIVAGAVVRVLGRGLRPAPAANPGEFDFRVRARSRRALSIVRVDEASAIRVLTRPAAWNPAALLDRLRAAGVAALEAHVAPQRSGLAAALLLGARESLPREEADDFLATGTVHVLSISGLHVGLVAAALFGICRTLAVSRPAALAGVAVCTGGYMLLVGAETPVVRATLVVWLTCLGAALGRRAAALNALAAAAVVVLVWRPAEAFSCGAQLSFLSTAVLVGMAAALRPERVPVDPIERLIDRSRPAAERRLRRWARQLWAVFVCGLAVWVVTVPLVAARFHVVSPVGLVLNVAIAPLVAAAMVAGFLCLVAAPVSGLVAGWCGAACDAALAGIGWLVSLGASVPGGHAWLPGPPGWWVVGWYAALAAALCLGAPDLLRRGRTWAALAAAWCVVGLTVTGVERLVSGGPGGLRAVVADVGHGCGIVVRSPAGRCLLYDAGRLGAGAAAARAVSSVLWSGGVSRIDVLVISHADADHFNAVADLVDRFAVTTVVVPPAFPGSSSAAADLIDRLQAARIPVRIVAAGDAFALDDLCRVRVLHPGPEPPVAGTPDNESSLVLAIESAGRRLLLPGDLEGPALERFVRGGPDACDVLVAPHHGSRTSLPPEIAAATRPVCILVSGAGGRSWPEVREAYRSAAGGSPVLLTGGSGALAVECTAREIRLERYVNGRWRRGFVQADAAAGRVRSQPAMSRTSWLATYAASSRSTPEVKP